jgi:hypothetical protein
MRTGLMSLQIIFLIALQVVTLLVLWFLSPITQTATDTFALYLSLDLLAFVMISYIYRSRRGGKEPSMAWLAMGYLSLMVLLVSNIIIST